MVAANETTVLLSCYDVAFQRSKAAFLRNADGFMLSFDLTNADSFESSRLRGSEL